MSAESSFWVTGGTVCHNARCYVERRADAELYERLLSGEFCYVLTARQLGKSSLMVRAAVRLRAAGARVALLDLGVLGSTVTPEQWYLGLLLLLGEQLGMRQELRRHWQENVLRGPLQRWITAVREVALPGRHSAGPDEPAEPENAPLVIFVDEVDTVLGLSFSVEEFFGVIRECYNSRAHDSRLRRLTFCLLGVARPSDLIRTARITPFDIGHRIELEDFSEQDAAPLAVGLEAGSGAGWRRPRKEAVALLARVLHWTGGHPYLTQKLCADISRHGSVKDWSSVDRRCEALFLTPSAREGDDNLSFVRVSLLHTGQDRAGLLRLYGRSLHRRGVSVHGRSGQVEALRLAGAVYARDGRLYARNRIYARVFNSAWIASQMAKAELRRQQAAYRNGLVRAGSFGGVVCSLVAGLGWSSYQPERTTHVSRAHQQPERGVQPLRGGNSRGLLGLAGAPPRKSYRISAWGADSAWNDCCRNGTTARLFTKAGCPTWLSTLGNRASWRPPPLVRRDPGIRKACVRSDFRCQVSANSARPQ